MTWLTDTVLRLAGPLVLVVVFALPAMEASTLLGLVVPGELALVLGGVLAHQGRVPLSAAVAATLLHRWPRGHRGARIRAPGDR